MYMPYLHCAHVCFLRALISMMNGISLSTLPQWSLSFNLCLTSVFSNWIRNVHNPARGQFQSMLRGKLYGIFERQDLAFKSLMHRYNNINCEKTLYSNRRQALASCIILILSCRLIKKENSLMLPWPCLFLPPFLQLGEIIINEIIFT